jgi:hypothetical protein
MKTNVINFNGSPKIVEEVIENKSLKSKKSVEVVDDKLVEDIEDSDASGMDYTMIGGKKKKKKKKKRKKKKKEQ